MLWEFFVDQYDFVRDFFFRFTVHPTPGTCDIFSGPRDSSKPRKYTRIIIDGTGKKILYQILYDTRHELSVLIF